MEIPDTDADVKSISDQRDRPNVLINNGILVIEELKPPDRPQDRELRDYVDKHTRSIQPATGDQGKSVCRPLGQLRRGSGQQSPLEQHWAH